MDNNHKQSLKANNPFIIKFNNSEYRLRKEDLQKQIGLKIAEDKDWSESTLKFLSFKDGRLTLINSSNRQSYLLTLMVTDMELQITCSCANSTKLICEHFYRALRNIIFFISEEYFGKLAPGGAIPLSFVYPRYFDKKEVKQGLDVSVRPELKSVFKMDQQVNGIDLAALLNLPTYDPIEYVALPALTPSFSDEAIGYYIILPLCRKLIPFVIPCAGKLNIGKTGIKDAYHFLSGAKKKFSHLLMDGQKELNSQCFDQWKLAEQLNGLLLDQNTVEKVVKSRVLVLQAWKQLISKLQQQPFVYTYQLYRIEELKKGVPAKNRIKKVTVAKETPKIQFQLADYGAFYQLEMKVLVNGQPIHGYNAGIPFLIVHNEAIYLLASLRDAAIVEWIWCSDEIITVFKVHFADFEKEILNPIRQHYPVLKAKRSEKRKPLSL